MSHGVDGMVLLHGFTGRPESFDGVVEGLGPGWRVLRPSLLGHGAEADGVATFDAEVDRVAGVIAERGLERAVLCGYSLGGRVALGLLLRHPQRFARAVVIGAHPGLADPAERAARLDGDERWARQLERQGIHAFVDAWEQQPLFATQRRLPAAARQRQREWRLRHDPAGLARSLRVLGLGRMPDLSPRLGEVRVPVRLLVGGEDAKFRRVAHDMAARLGGDPSVRVVPGAGHNVVLERPGEVTKALL
jgi:2-succinyl-6-hydroxy-2,4-cyclohexadiene-1-carboxylate synthase